MNRKPRKDSILHNLSPEKRVKVDKWLFDKGMSYMQVAEACGRFLGVKVSKSSVARYFAAVIKSRVAPMKKASALANQRISELREQPTWEGKYQVLIKGLMDAAWEAMGRFEFELKHEGYTDFQEARWIVKLMRLIISARRAEHVRTLAMAERAAIRNRFSFLVSGLKFGRKQRSSLAGVQGAESFVALCARWDRERERELTGGQERWW